MLVSKRNNSTTHFGKQQEALERYQSAVSGSNPENYKPVKWIGRDGGDSSCDAFVRLRQRPRESVPEEP
jgi:hypothetical protein